MSDFYMDESLRYHARTFHIDPSPFLEPLLKWIPSGARILDVGCGSGRDLLWLKNLGYRVTGFERSPALAAIAVEKANAPVIVGDFETYDFSEFFVDAVILVGALVHIPPERFCRILRNILRALKPAGHVLLTLKEGLGSRTVDDGRVFYLWSREELRESFNACSLDEKAFSRQSSALENGDVWLTFMLRKSAGS